MSLGPDAPIHQLAANRSVAAHAGESLERIPAMTNGYAVAIEANQLPVLKSGHFLFTSESVGEGHPDKMCDQISDAILDACLQQDPQSRVACEVAAKADSIMVLGEITSRAKISFPQIIHNTLSRIGYDDDAQGLDFKTCHITTIVEQQSPEISQSVASQNGQLECTGAGDQGIMFGYATDETPELMPLSLMLAHRLTERLAQLRKSGELAWLRPDCKSQVTVEYRLEGGATIPLRVHTVVLSAQHAEGIPMTEIRELLLEKVVKAVIPHHYLDQGTIYHLQPSGKFVIGGPKSDAGLTGRKIIVDTYGGWGAHGGGAFSGKDWTKVDRSGAYAARWVAKSIVAAGLARRCLIQLSYSIGLMEPLSIFIDTFGTSKQSHADLVDLINRHFDLRPGAIAKALDLAKPIYEPTACYGHFGRANFSWEKPKPLPGPDNPLSTGT